MRTLAFYLVVMTALCAAAFGQTSSPSPPAAPGAGSDAGANAAIEQIRQAPNPSAAVEAYARAVAAPGGAGNVAVEQAYVRKVVELGVPEMAEAQAQDLIKRDPSGSGLAYGVAAYMAAATGQNDAAIANLQTALKQAADDPFVLRTAGQLVAWYDGLTDRSALSEASRKAVEEIRSACANRSAFADAYRLAASRSRSGYPATQPAAAYDASSAAPAPSAPQTYYPPGYYAPGGYDAYYTNPYVGTYLYEPVYPFYPDAFIVRDRIFVDRLRHHHFDGRFEDGRRFDGRREGDGTDTAVHLPVREGDRGFGPTMGPFPAGAAPGPSRPGSSAGPGRSAAPAPARSRAESAPQRSVQSGSALPPQAAPAPAPAPAPARGPARSGNSGGSDDGGSHQRGR